VFDSLIFVDLQILIMNLNHESITTKN